MINVAVVDDEEIYLDQIKKVVSQFFFSKKIEIHIHTYRSGEELLKSKLQFDIVFLDIQMDGIDGIETAQMFRKGSKSTAFFYVTSYAEYILKAMTMHPFAYIIKPIQPNEIQRNLMDYIEYKAAQQSEDDTKVICVSNKKGQTVYISFNDILYFHYAGNRVVEAVTSDEIYYLHSTIAKLYESLDKDMFLFPQQSFIINIHYIQTVDGKYKSLTMKNGSVVLISRGRYRNFMNLLNEKFCK